MDTLKKQDATIAVALRKESVDRNVANKTFFFIGIRSLSARRAWIEIIHPSAN